MLREGYLIANPRGLQLDCVSRKRSHMKQISSNALNQSPCISGLAFVELLTRYNSGIFRVQLIFHVPEINTNHCLRRCWRHPEEVLQGTHPIDQRISIFGRHPLLFCKREQIIGNGPMIPVYSIQSGQWLQFQITQLDFASEFCGDIGKPLKGQCSYECRRLMNLQVRNVHHAVSEILGEGLELGCEGGLVASQFNVLHHTCQ